MNGAMTQRTWQAWARPDGRKGIRDAIVVVYLVECAHHVARRIVEKMDDPRVQLIGFPGCYPNDYALAMMKALTTHPNVGGVVLLSLGCESFNREALAAHAREQGRPVETIVIQQSGGTRGAMEAGIAAVERVRAQADAQAVRVPMTVSELVIGTICGGSDGTSGITGNPAVGRAFDTLYDAGAICIFEETGEMIGCEGHMAERAATPEVAQDLIASVAQAERYYRAMGYGSFAPGNAEGGLTSQEEKSAGLCQVGQPPDHRRHPARRTGRGRGCTCSTWCLRATPRLSQHRRQCRDRRADRVRRAYQPVRDRARIGGRLGHLAGHQDRRQSGNVRPDGRRYGRERGSHPVWRRHAGRGGCRDRRPDRRGVGRGRDQVGSAGASGVRPDLQGGWGEGAGLSTAGGVRGGNSNLFTS